MCVFTVKEHNIFKVLLSIKVTIHRPIRAKQLQRLLIESVDSINGGGPDVPYIVKQKCI